MSTALCLVIAGSAGAGTLDFEPAAGFQVGQKIFKMNAILQTSEVLIAAVSCELDFGPELQVSHYPGQPSSHVLYARTHPTGADILLNFASAVDSVTVTFLPVPGDPSVAVLLIARDQTGTALEIQPLPSIALVTADSPQTLTVSARGIRSVQLESNSDYIYVDNISYTPEAEPCAADLNGDGHVDAADLAFLLGAWGMCR
jgi:hypothetical protein